MALKRDCAALMLLCIAAVAPCQAQPERTPRLHESGLRELNKYRPAIAVFYYPGHPGHYALGKDARWDLQRISGYFDACGVDLDGLWNLGAPDELEKSRETAKGIGGHNTGIRKFGLGSFVHTHGGIPGWFMESADWYGLSREMVWGDPKWMCAISDPRYYEQVVRRYAEEVIGGVPEDEQPDLWWLESEPGPHYIDFNRVRTIECAQTAELWQRYLTEQLGDVSKLNRAAGTHFKDFSEVSLKDDNWLVRILVARFASWVLYNYYQGQQIEAWKEHSKGTPVSTRWCEMSAWGLDPRDFSRFDTVDADYLGFTWYAGNPFLPYTGKNRALLGKATSNFSLLRFYGKPISSGELGYWRGRPEDVTHFPDRDFGALRAFRPWELENLLYRCLYYKVGLHCLFNYTFPNDNISWSSHAQYPDLLKTVRNIIADWDRIRPYAEFGEALPNEVGIVISRNARLYPITGDMMKDDHYYGDVWLGAMPIMEDPSLSYFDIMEEHAPLVKQEWLNRYKGLIVYDACLSTGTREVVDRFAATGKPVLVIGAPRYVDGLHLPAESPASYPVSAVVGPQMADSALPVESSHPLLKGIDELSVLAPTEVQPADGAEIVATAGGKPVFVVRANVAYLSAMPFDLAVRTQLYRNFLQWCGARVHDLYVSRFANAIVLQNYKSEFIRTWVDGEILQQFPQITPRVVMEGAADGQLWEMKGDFPWLAYEDTPRGKAIEAIHFDTCQVRVFQHMQGPVYPHFESCPEGLGFTRFTLGTLRARGYFKVSAPGTYTLRLATGMWGDRKVRWQLTKDQPLDERILAKGDGSDISFEVTEAGDALYRLEIISEPSE